MLYGQSSPTLNHHSTIYYFNFYWEFAFQIPIHPTFCFCYVSATLLQIPNIDIPLMIPQPLPWPSMILTTTWDSIPFHGYFQSHRHTQTSWANTDPPGAAHLEMWAHMLLSVHPIIPPSIFVGLILFPTSFFFSLVLIPSIPISVPSHLPHTQHMSWTNTHPQYKTKQKLYSNLFTNQHTKIWTVQY